MSSTLKLRDGSEIPAVAFGTGTSFRDRPVAEVAAAVCVGWDCGYRFFDTAQIYNTEEAVGVALETLVKERGVKREEFMVMTKALACQHKYQQRLRLDYVDFFLVHGAASYYELGIYKDTLSAEEVVNLPKTKEELARSRAEVWTAMQDLKKAGKVKHIGVSNFIRSHIEQLIKEPSCHVVPEINQIELNPYLHDQDIVGYCHENGIMVQAYSPLGNGKGPKKIVSNDIRYVLDDPVVASVASGKGCTAAQVCLSWLRHKGIAAVTKSERRDRLLENIGSLGVILDKEEVEKIDRLDQGQRFCIDPYAAQ